MWRQRSTTMPWAGRGRGQLSRAVAGAIALSLMAVVGTGAGHASASTSARASATGTAPVVLIVMENRPYQNIVGSKFAPFINQTLIPGGMVDTHYLGAPGSLPDYMVMLAGARTPAASAPNIFTALGSTTSWSEFMESAPSTCYMPYTFGLVHGSTWGLYTKYHNPALAFTAVSKTSLCNNIVPLDAAHFDPLTLPRFSFVAPNECNDMHTLPTNHLCPMWDGTMNSASNIIKMGDQWLASIVPLMAKTATVIVTWDEGVTSNEQVLTVEYGVGVTAGTDATAYTHSSMEAGLYAYLGLGTPPGSGATATPLPIP
jgi:phosphatidylinositol-3-phosphatase